MTVEPNVTVDDRAASAPWPSGERRHARPAGLARANEKTFAGAEAGDEELRRLDDLRDEVNAMVAK